MTVQEKLQRFGLMRPVQKKIFLLRCKALKKADEEKQECIEAYEQIKSAGQDVN